MADGDLLWAVGPERAGGVPGAVRQPTGAGAAVLGSGQRAGPTIWAFVIGVAVRGGDPSNWKEEIAAPRKGETLGGAGFGAKADQTRFCIVRVDIGEKVSFWLVCQTAIEGRGPAGITHLGALRIQASI